MSKDRELIPHLHCHSEYSISHGMLRLRGASELGRLAAERGIGAVALTDTNNIHAAIRHQASCRRHGVKPILGCVASFIRADQHFQATLLCQDASGFRNLAGILTQAQLENGGRIDAASLDRHDTQGLIMLNGYGGDACAALRQGKQALARDLLGQWREVFPEGRLGCEITFGGRLDEDILAHHLATLAQQAGIPAVAAHPVLFASAKDYYHHEVRTCIANSWKLESKARPRLHTERQFFLSAEEMRHVFREWPGALANAAEIARRCNYDFGLHTKPQFPHFLNSGEDAPTLLRKRAAAGLERLHPPAGDRGKFARRLASELEVIVAKGFADYFLIVADFVQFARDHDIPVGPGRGSGAGSLVAYALGITGVDPLRYGLLFERFLNLERTALPDFDIDFCTDRRGEIIAHARQVYGADCVAQVVTFGSLKAKAVVRDVCRVLGLGYMTGDRFARLIPTDLNITLTDARSKASDLDGFIREQPAHEQVWEHSLALEGMPRQPSTHAAAILIAPNPLTEYCPLMIIGDHHASEPVCQYDKDAAEAIGLVKFDFLGLKNLTMLHLAEREVRKKHKDFRLADIDLHDTASLRIYCKGNTVGVFQCESQGMIALMRQMQPSSLEDIALVISMYRPGVLATNMHRTYLANRANPAATEYPHELVRTVLEPTFGVMIYQEQVMRLSQVLAGFSLAKADTLRTAIGKKDVALMARLGDDFIAASTKFLGANGARKLFAAIKEFAGYGFNKSHAVAYALVSLQTAFLKANHRAIFYAASLTTWVDDSKTQALLLEDARTSAHGKEGQVEVLLPCVNASRPEFTATGNATIRYGLGSVRGIGIKFARQLVAERDTNGKFASLEELCGRMPQELINRRVLVNLIWAGACDCLMATAGEPAAWRPELESQIDAALDYVSFQRQHANQENLFGNKEGTRAATHGNNGNGPARPWHQEALLQKEEVALGVPLSGNYYDIYRWLLRNLGCLRKVADSVGDGMHTWAGHVSKYTTNARIREQGREVFVISDGTASVEVNTQRKAVDDDVELSGTGTVVVVEAKVGKNYHGDTNILRAHRVHSLDHWCAAFARTLLRPAGVADTQWVLDVLRALREKRAPGPTALCLQLQQDSLAGEIDLGLRLTLKAGDLVKLAERLGPDRVLVS